MSRQQTCENCRFLDDNYKDGDPRCHRYPPQSKDERITPKSESSIIPGIPFTANFWRFPKVHKDDWCGEWRPIHNSGNRSAYHEE